MSDYLGQLEKILVVGEEVCFSCQLQRTCEKSWRQLLVPYIKCEESGAIKTTSLFPVCEFLWPKLVFAFLTIFFPPNWKTECCLKIQWFVTGGDCMAGGGIDE